MSVLFCACFVVLKQAYCKDLGSSTQTVPYKKCELSETQHKKKKKKTTKCVKEENGTYMEMKVQ